MIIVFWIGCFISLYSYALYPLLLLLFTRRSLPIRNEGVELPTLTVIVTVHNGEKSIAKKLEETLGLGYPKERYEILVASDASTDGTDDVVKRFYAQGVRLVRSDVRKGKEHAQYLAIGVSKGSVLVFTDVGTQLQPGALHTLAAHFSNPAIGAVSSEDRLETTDNSVRGEGAYVQYEMWLRKLESAAAGLVGLSGSCFAVRRAVCNGWRIDTPSDITVALLCAQSGLRAITDNCVIGTYQDIKQESQEFARKKRTMIRGMTAVWELRDVLSVRKTGWFAFEVWSHKIMRWLVPLGLVATLGSSAVLARGSAFFQTVFLLQSLGYAAAAAGFISRSARRFAPIRIALFFVVVNAAAAAAAWDYLRGVRIVTWNPSRR